MGPDGHVSFKATDIAFEMLPQMGLARPAPYAAKAKWVEIAGLHVLPAAELKDYLKTAHALVAAKLTRKARQAIGIA
jgi:predicted DNA-binding protein (MmcQ/YjbR family)